MIIFVLPARSPVPDTQRLLIIIVFRGFVYWGIVASQRCASFCCTTKQISHMHTYNPSLDGIVHLGHHGASSRVPRAIQQALTSYLFHAQQCMHVIPIPQFIPLPLSRFGVHTFDLYVCVSVSALQVGSSVSFFLIPHNVLIYDISFSLTYFRDISQLHL